MLYTVKCTICGREFKGQHNAKYCQACRIEKERTRKRELHRKQRAEDAEIARQARAKAAAKEQAKRQRQLERKQAKEEASLQERAAAGDLRAVMKIACNNMEKCGNNTSAEYWENYSKFVIANAEQAGFMCGLEVNGVSVYAENFGEAVAASIHTTGRIVKAGSPCIKRQDGGA